IVNVGKAHDREHRAKLLLANEPGVVGDVADDRRPDEKALPVDCLAAGDDLAVPPCVLKERLHLLELRIWTVTVFIHPVVAAGVETYQCSHTSGRCAPLRSAAARG